MPDKGWKYWRKLFKRKTKHKSKGKRLKRGIKETPVFPLGIAAIRRRNPGEKMVTGSIPHQGPLLIPLNRLLNFWYWSDEFEKQARTRKVTSTVRGCLYPVHRTPTDDPIYGGGNGQGEGR